MFIYFPGYGILMSTIDPSFLIKEYPLTSKAWFDVKLLMKIQENLPKDVTRCKTKKYSNIRDLVKIHTEHEQCILQNFEKNWSKRNQSCFTFVIQNFLEENRSLSIGKEKMCANLEYKSDISNDIYPAMENDSCLKPCTQVMINWFLIIFKQF